MAEQSRLPAAVVKHSQLQANHCKLQAAAPKSATKRYTRESTTSPSWPSGQARGHGQWVLDRGAKHSGPRVVVKKVQPST